METKSRSKKRSKRIEKNRLKGSLKRRSKSKRVKSQPKKRSKLIKDYGKDNTIENFKNLFDNPDTRLTFNRPRMNTIFFSNIKLTTGKEHPSIFVTKEMRDGENVYTFMEDDIEYQIDPNMIIDFTLETENL